MYKTINILYQHRKILQFAQQVLVRSAKPSILAQETMQELPSNLLYPVQETKSGKLGGQCDKQAGVKI